MKKLVLLSFMCVSGLAFAEEDKPFSIDAELGVLITSGNTDSTAAQFKLDAKQNLEHWKNNYIFEGLYKEDEVEVTEGGQVVRQSQKTADRLFASAQSDYKLDSKHKGVFVYASYEDDKFSGFDYQATLAVGYSDRLFETEKSWLDYSVGPGFVLARTEETLDALGAIVPSEKTEEFALRASGAYRYNFSEHAKFTQKVSADISADSDSNTKIKSETALSSNLNSTMALKLSYTVNHNTKPPQDKEKSDTTTAVTIVFSY